MSNKKEDVQDDDPLNKTIWEVNNTTTFTNKTVMVKGLYRHIFFDVMLPFRYRVDKDGVHLNIGKRGHELWINISRTACAIQNIDLSKDDVGFDCTVVFMTAIGTAMAIKVNQGVLLTKQIQHLITIMQKEGAICTANDARRLNSYFKECLTESIKGEGL
jgi:hypothetical protein